jgi:hypothetical protein
MHIHVYHVFRVNLHNTYSKLHMKTFQGSHISLDTFEWKYKL